MPPPGVRFVRDNGNGTSQWQGPGGAVVDVHHARADMADFAPPQQQLADNTPAPQAAPVGTQTPGVQWSASPQYDAASAYIQGQARAQQAAVPQASSEAQALAEQLAAQRPAVAHSQTSDDAINRQVAEVGGVTVGAQPMNVGLDAQQTGGVRAGQRDIEAGRQREANAAVGDDYVTHTPGQNAANAQSQGERSGGVTVFGGGGGPARTSMQVRGVSTTTQSGDAPMPGLLDDVRANTDETVAAYRHIGKNQTDNLADWERTLADRNRQIGGLMDESVANERGRGNRLEQARLNFEDIASRARSMTVDPDRRTGGDRVVGAVASLLGGIGSGITGGPNHAVQIIQHAIDRDVEAQRSNVSNAQHGTAAAQTAYQLARDQGASEREAENVHMGFEYRRAADEAERLAALTGSQEAMDRAQLLIGPLREREYALLGNLNHLQSGHTSETVQQAPVRTGGQGRAHRAYVYTNPTTGETRMATDEEVRGVREDLGISGDHSEERLAAQGYRLGSAGASSQVDQHAIQRYTEHAAAMEGPVSTLNYLQRVLRGSPEDLPGSGPIEGRITNWLTSERGREVQQAIAATDFVSLLAASGRQVLQHEADRIHNATRMVASARPDEIRNGIRILDNLVGAPYRALRSGLSDADRAEVDRRRRSVDQEAGVNMSVDPNIRPAQ